MAYSRINWQNEPSEATALNDVNLNKMDSAIYDHDQRLDTAEGDIGDIETALDNKVDKVSGKGLSEVKSLTVTKLTDVGTDVAQVYYLDQSDTPHATYIKNGITVDSALSSSSTNPVQNKKVKEALDDKVDKESGKGLSTLLALGITAVNTGTQIADILAIAQDGQEYHNYIKNGVVVHSAMSNETENPVQNKVVKSAIDDKVDKEEGKGITTVAGVSYVSSVNNGTVIGSLQVDKVGGGNIVSQIRNGVVVDSALSSSSTNPVENKAIYDSLNNLLPSKTVSGNPISISDASGFNAKALTVSMNPIQDLSHGNPSPTNICPISGRTEASVTRTGVNQWDEQWELGTLNTTNGSETVNTTQIRAKNYVPIQPSKQYYFKADNPVWVLFFDANKAVISENLPPMGQAANNARKSNNQPFTTPPNCSYIRFYFQGSYGTTYNHDTSVNYPSNITAYYAYNGSPETHTHEYSETIYGGVDDFVSGEGSSEWGLIDLGTLNWQYHTQSGNFYADGGIVNRKAQSNAICSQYVKNNVEVTGVANLTTNNRFAFQASVSTRIIIRDTTYTDAETFKTSMDGVQLCYELANPTTISTSAEEIELLKGQNVLSTDADDIELKYSVSLDSLLP